MKGRKSPSHLQRTLEIIWKGKDALFLLRAEEPSQPQVKRLQEENVGEDEMSAGMTKKIKTGIDLTEPQNEIPLVQQEHARRYPSL